MNRNLRIFFLFFIMTSALRADYGANFQLIVVAPDPVEAGSSMKIQVIVKNSGSETWNSGSYCISADIYDTQKNYLAKTEKEWGNNTILPGQSALFFIDYTIPTNWIGKYFLRVNMSSIDKTIEQSEFVSVGVEAFIGAAALPPPIKLGGNIILSYRQEYSKEIDNSYLGNSNISLFGKFEDNSMTFNSYTVHKKDKHFDIDNMLFMFQTPKMTFMAGDIMPEFSKFSLYGSGLNGGYLRVKQGNVFTSLTAAQSVDAKEGTALTNGVFARYIYGVSVCRSGSAFGARISGVQAYDDKNSILVSGPSAAPLENNLGSLKLNYNPLDNLSFEGEYAYSALDDDTLSDGDKEKDSAWRAGAALEAGPVKWDCEYSLIQPQFHAPGNAAVIGDRSAYDTNFDIKFSELVTMESGYNFYRDNLDNRSDKVTMKNNTADMQLLLTPKRLPDLTLGASLSTVKAKPSTAANNSSLVYFFDSRMGFGGSNLNLGSRMTQFRDSTSSGNDTDTGSLYFNLQSLWTPGFATNAGGSASRNRNILTDDAIDTVAGSLMFNFTLNKKQGLNFWVRDMIYKSDSITSPVETRTSSVNFEFRQAITGDDRIVIGAGYKDYSDKLISASSYSTYNGQIRMVIGF